MCSNQVTHKRIVLFMTTLEKIYNIAETTVINIVGLSCDNWRKCKCEDCVLVRKMITQSLLHIGFSRKNIQRYSKFSKSSISAYISDNTESRILSLLRSEIRRELSEKGIMIEKQ